MTNASQTKPIPIPSLLVYGKPTSPDLPQASWFRAEDKQAARAAAIALKFSVIDIETEAERALTVGVHEGVLKGSGRMIVGTVSNEVYRRIDEYARNASKRLDTPTNPSQATSASEQTTNTGAGDIPATSSAPTRQPTASPDSKPATAASPATVSTGKPDNAHAPPNPWETLRVGARVLAAYWNEKREFEGFWLAIVKRIDKGEFTLEWFESPDYPAFKIATKNVALPHPDFRPTGK
jgi:hypothetical protein